MNAKTIINQVLVFVLTISMLSSAVSASYWVDGIYIDLPQTRCEIQSSSCPIEGSYVGTFTEKTVLEANTDMDRCLRRPYEYVNYCKSSQPVTATFYVGDYAIQSNTAPAFNAPLPTRCEISIASCPNFPNQAGTYTEFAVPAANSNQARCMQRPAEYVNWCGSSQPVTATYYVGTSAVQSNTAPGIPSTVAVPAVPDIHVQSGEVGQTLPFGYSSNDPNTDYIKAVACQSSGALSPGSSYCPNYIELAADWGSSPKHPKTFSSTWVPTAAYVGTYNYCVSACNRNDQCSAQKCVSATFSPSSRVNFGQPEILDAWVQSGAVGSTLTFGYISNTNTAYVLATNCMVSGNIPNANRCPQYVDMSQNWGSAPNHPASFSSSWVPDKGFAGATYSFCFRACGSDGFCSPSKCTTASWTGPTVDFRLDKPQAVDGEDTLFSWTVNPGATKVEAKARHVSGSCGWTQTYGATSNFITWAPAEGKSSGNFPWKMPTGATSLNGCTFEYCLTPVFDGLRGDQKCVTLTGISPAPVINPSAYATPYPTPAPVVQNTAPVLQKIGNKVAKVGKLIQFTILGTDANNNPLTYSASGLPSGSTFVGNLFSWTPKKTQSGEHKVTFSANDGTATVSETVTFNVKSNAPKVRIKGVNFPSGDEIAAGDQLIALVKLENDGGDDLDDLQVKAYFVDEGLEVASDRFDIDEGDSASRVLAFDIPADMEPGVYYVGFSIRNDDVSKVVYREITVV